MYALLTTMPLKRS